MDAFTYAAALNIKRFETLLEASVDGVERRLLQVLLAEEKVKAGIKIWEPSQALSR